jgi:hypothetical protein
MNEAVTTTITINKSEKNKIKFYGDNEEMMYNDHMYDIAKTSETETTITYYCINDSKETNLIASLDDHINTHVAANKPLKDNGSKKITEHVVKIYFATKNTFTFDLTTKQTDFAEQNMMYVSAQKQNCTPPPPEFS